MRIQRTETSTTHQGRLFLASGDGHQDRRAGTWKSVMVAGRQNLKTTIKKLTKGKNYCFRVRSYVEHTSISSGQTLRTWSQFSPVVYVKVTK